MRYLKQTILLSLVFLAMVFFVAKNAQYAIAETTNATFNMTLNETQILSPEDPPLPYSTSDGLEDFNLTTNETRTIGAGETIWLRQCTTSMGGTLTGTLNSHETRTLYPGRKLLLFGTSPVNYGKKLTLIAYNTIDLVKGGTIGFVDSPGGPNNGCGT